jgi:adenosine kinase
MIRSGDVDIVFANRHEVAALYQTADFETALGCLGGEAKLAVVTLGAEGSMALRGGERTLIPAAPVDRVVDLTGAGDLYAAGFLFGLARGLPLAECGRYGSLAAAEVISHVGPRPVALLSELSQGAGLAA